MRDKSLEQAVVRRCRKVRRELTPRVMAALADRPLMETEFAVSLNVTQNVIRECMTVAMNEAMPQQHLFFGELAIRLACYAITCLPADDQEVMALAVSKGIMEKLGHMQSEGIVIDAEWT